MVNDTLKQIEDAVRRISSIDGGKKEELLGLLAALKTEVGRLPGTQEEHAQSIAGLAQVAAHEATRKEKSPGLLKHSLEGLALSAKGFEASHPQLSETINEICALLARIGI